MIKGDSSIKWWSALVLTLMANLITACGIQQQAKDDQSAAYTKLQNANYVVSQMNTLNSRVQSSKKTSAAAKSAAATALSYAKSLSQQVQSDYATESSKQETDTTSASNSSASNADDSRMQNLAKQVNNAAQTAISYASSAGVQTSDVNPSPYLSVVGQP